MFKVYWLGDYLGTLVAVIFLMSCQKLQARHDGLATKVHRMLFNYYRFKPTMFYLQMKAFSCCFRKVSNLIKGLSQKEGYENPVETFGKVAHKFVYILFQHFF